MSANEREPDPTGFSVLVVCTANQCRSPMAEHLLRAELELRGLDWSVGSAGLSARPGEPMHRFASRILEGRGIDSTGWTSRLLVVDLLDQVDLVVTATEAHRAAVARLSPPLMARTFTLRQLAHLLRAAPRPAAVGGSPIASSGYGEALVAQAGAARGRLQPLPEPERDLADPIGHSFRRFRQCATAIEQSVRDILAGAPVATRPGGD